MHVGPGVHVRGSPQHPRQPRRPAGGRRRGRAERQLRGHGPRLARLRGDPARDPAGLRVHDPRRGRAGNHDRRRGDRVFEPPAQGGIAMPKTDNAVVIDRPLDVVWERMNDVERWPDLFSEYAKAEILEQEGDTVKFRLTTHPDPEYDGQVWTWVSERTVDPETHSVKAHRIETGPFDHMNIEWYFEPADGGTKMRWVQDFSMKPEAPADDEHAQEYVNRNTLEQMRVIKERLEGDAG